MKVLLMLGFLFACNGKLEYGTKVKIRCSDESYGEYSHAGSVGYIVKYFDGQYTKDTYTVRVKSKIGHIDVDVKSKNCLEVVK